jgi:hypothetical protein
MLPTKTLLEDFKQQLVNAKNSRDTLSQQLKATEEQILRLDGAIQALVLLDKLSANTETKISKPEAKKEDSNVTQ